MFVSCKNLFKCVLRVGTHVKRHAPLIKSHNHITIPTLIKSLTTTVNANNQLNRLIKIFTSFQFTRAIHLYSIFDFNKLWSCEAPRKIESSNTLFAFVTPNIRLFGVSNNCWCNNRLILIIAMKLFSEINVLFDVFVCREYHFIWKVKHKRNHYSISYKIIYM